MKILNLWCGFQVKIEISDKKIKLNRNEKISAANVPKRRNPDIW